MRRLLVLTIAVSILATAVAAAGPVAATASAPTGSSGTTITLMTHDSFAVSKSVMRQFTKQTGVKVDVLPSGQPVLTSRARFAPDRVELVVES